MIPLLAALPVAQDVLSGVGSVAGGFLHSFAPSETPLPQTTNTVTFSSALSQASKSIQAAAGKIQPGILRAEQWSQMSGPELQSWAQSLAGHHVDATDAAGHAITGVVSGVNFSGGTVSLTIDGHNVPLSNLKQVSWCAAAV